MDDPKIDVRCQRIYKNHRRAIDLIIESSRIKFTRIVEAIADKLRERQDCQLISSAPKGVFFVPKMLLELLPAIPVAANVDPRAWIMWEFRCEEQGCKLYVYGCPTSDIDLRRRVLRRLTENPKEFGFRLFSRNIQSLCQTKGADAVNNTEINHFRFAAHLISHVFEADVIDA